MVLEVFASISHFAVSSPALLAVGLAASLFLISVAAIGYLCHRGRDTGALELVFRRAAPPAIGSRRRGRRRSRSRPGRRPRECSQSPLLARRDVECGDGDSVVINSDRRPCPPPAERTESERRSAPVAACHSGQEQVGRVVSPDPRDRPRRPASLQAPYDHPTDRRLPGPADRAVTADSPLPTPCRSTERGEPATSGTGRSPAGHHRPLRPATRTSRLDTAAGTEGRHVNMRSGRRHPRLSGPPGQ